MSRLVACLCLTGRPVFDRMRKNVEACHGARPLMNTPKCVCPAKSLHTRVFFHAVCCPEGMVNARTGVKVKLHGNGHAR